MNSAIFHYIRASWSIWLGLFKMWPWAFVSLVPELAAVHALHILLSMNGGEFERAVGRKRPLSAGQRLRLRHAAAHWRA